MVSFKFSFGVVGKSKEKGIVNKYVIIVAKCDDSSEYKYFIVYNNNTYIVDYNWTSIYNKIYFKNKKDAQSVIDNPNFRAILNAIYKN